MGELPKGGGAQGSLMGPGGLGKREGGVRVCLSWVGPEWEGSSLLRSLRGPHSAQQASTPASNSTSQPAPPCASSDSAGPQPWGLPQPQLCHLGCLHRRAKAPPGADPLWTQRPTCWSL